MKTARETRIIQIRNIQLSCNQFINAHVEEEDAGQRRRRYKKITQADLIGKTAGRWTRQEHLRFIQALRLHGKDWKKVEDFIGTRTGAQIRSHAQKYFMRIEQELNVSGLAFPSSGGEESGEDDYEEDSGFDSQPEEVEEHAHKRGAAPLRNDTIESVRGVTKLQTQSGKKSVSLKAPQTSMIEGTPLLSTSSKDQSHIKSHLRENPMDSKTVEGFMVEMNEEDKGGDYDQSEPSNKKENDTSEQPAQNDEIVTAEDLNPSQNEPLETEDRPFAMASGNDGRERLYSMQSDYSNHLPQSHKPAASQFQTNSTLVAALLQRSKSEGHPWDRANSTSLAKSRLRGLI